MLALVDFAAGRSASEIPGAAFVFSAEDFVGELDTVVFKAGSSVPGA